MRPDLKLVPRERTPHFDADAVDLNDVVELGNVVDEALGLLREARIHSYLDGSTPHHDAIRTLLRECDEKITEVAEALGGPVG